MKKKRVWYLFYCLFCELAPWFEVSTKYNSQLSDDRLHESEFFSLSIINSLLYLFCLHGIFSILHCFYVCVCVWIDTYMHTRSYTHTHSRAHTTLLGPRCTLWYRILHELCDNLEVLHSLKIYPSTKKLAENCLNIKILKSRKKERWRIGETLGAFIYSDFLHSDQISPKLILSSILFGSVKMRKKYILSNCWQCFGFLHFDSSACDNTDAKLCLSLAQNRSQKRGTNVRRQLPVWWTHLV